MTAGKSRGVAEIVSTLLLVSMTVIASIMLYSYLSGYVNSSRVWGSVSMLRLEGYDTRDGGSISGLSYINNRDDGRLCARSCRNNTEFIAVYVRNPTGSWIRLDGIMINGAMHQWDRSGSLYPQQGMFMILPLSGYRGDNWAQHIRSYDSNEIPPSSTVRLLIRLSPNLDDISIGERITLLAVISDGRVYKWEMVGGTMG